jgi:hypothetical protein
VLLELNDNDSTGLEELFFELTSTVDAYAA